MSVQRHTALNLAGSLLPIAASLVTIPAYLHLIGEARYGVLAMAWLLLGYFGLFDLGLGRATAQRMATLAQAGAQARADSLWTSLLVNLLLGVCGGAVLLVVASWAFGHYFKVADQLRPELAAALPWLGLALPVATLSGVLTGALQGRSAFLPLNLISASGALLTQVVPLAVAWHFGPNLASLIPAVLLTRAFTLVCLFRICQRDVLRGFAPRIKRAQIGPLLAFGGWVSLTSLVGPLMVALDRLVIGVQMGAQAVTHYTLPFQLGERTSILPDALGSALFPRLADPGQDAPAALALQATRSLAVVLTPVMLLGLLGFEGFLRVWVGTDLAALAHLPGELLLLGFWINAFARIPYAELQAAGRPDRVAKCHVLELGPYLAGLYLGLHFFGLPGAALAFSVRTVADWALLSALAGGLRNGLRVLALPAGLLLATLALVLCTAVDDGVRWLAGGGLWLACMIWCWQAAPPALRRLALSALPVRQGT